MVLGLLFAAIFLVFAPFFIIQCIADSALSVIVPLIIISVFIASFCNYLKEEDDKQKGHQ